MQNFSILKDIEAVLSEKENTVSKIMKERFIFKKTLKETGDSLGITRERVRQIEVRTVAKVLNKQTISLIKEEIIKQIKKDGILLEKDFFNLFGNTDSSLVLLGLIKSGRIPGLYTNAENSIFHIDKTTLKDIENALNDYEDETKCPIIKTNDTINNILFDENLNNTLTNIGFFAKINNDTFSMHPSSKRKALEIWVASLGLDGFPLLKRSTQVRKFLEEIFPDLFATGCNINGYLNNNKNLILKEWGVYIHISNARDQMENWPKETFFKEVSLFLQNHKRYNVEKFFKENEESLFEIGITSMHLLYEIARNTLSSEFEFKHTPWISLAGNTISVTAADSVEEYAEKVNGPFSVSDFAKFLGISSGRALQIILSSKNIEKVSKNSYIMVKTI